MSAADIIAIAVGVGGLVAQILLGIQNNRIAERQNEIFREQNRIFAAQAGVKMSEQTLLKKNKFAIYWPTIAAAFTAVLVGIIVSRLQGSLIFSVTSSVIMVLAFAHIAWRERSMKPLAVGVSPPVVILADPSSAKPEHNVRFVGFEVIDWDFKVATFVFRNEPNGKLLGNFVNPRLSVTYYEYTTGQELDDFYSLHWMSEESEITEITAAGKNVTIAIFTNEWRVGGEDEPLGASLYEDHYIASPDRGRSTVLPFGELRIVATLYGNYTNEPVLTVRGVLTLNLDGTASFTKDV